MQKGETLLRVLIIFNYMNLKEFKKAREKLLESKAEREAKQFLGFMYGK